MARAATSMLALVLLTPLLALFATAVLDSGPGPGSAVRVSPFPLVLTAYDTLTWTSVGNSLAVSAIVACGALVGGVTLGRLLARWRFWGRPVFVVLLTLTAVIPPTLSALGLLGLFGSRGPRAWQALVRALLAPDLAERAWPWLAWTWSA
ncbi:MAG: hypothetical protein ACP5XB_08295, partial [Isosphaeraceae bacterium]